jgi:hypothetical protein
VGGGIKQRQWPRFTPAWEKYHGVKPDDLRRITAVVGEVLPGRVLTRDELAKEIAAALHKPALDRFLDTYGPATHEDFGRWWGTDAASARRIFAGHGLAQRCPVQDRRINRNNVPASAHWAWSSRRLPPILLSKGRS